MKVSIFKDLTFATWVDYSYTPPIEHSPEVKDEEGNILSHEVLAKPGIGNPDCVACLDLEFDPTIQTIEVTEKKGKFTATVVDLPPRPETPEEKHDRVYQSIIMTENLDDVDLEGEVFSDFEIGEIITARVFGGNPHAEKALTNKVLAVAISLLQWDQLTPEMQDKLSEAQLKKAHVDEIRNLFNLENL